MSPQLVLDLWVTAKANGIYIASFDIILQVFGIYQQSSNATFHVLAQLDLDEPRQVGHSHEHVGLSSCLPHLGSLRIPRLLGQDSRFVLLHRIAIAKHAFVNHIAADSEL